MKTIALAGCLPDWQVIYLSAPSKRKLASMVQERAQVRKIDRIIMLLSKLSLFLSLRMIH